VAGTCEHGNELPGSINAGNFLTSCKREERRLKVFENRVLRRVSGPKRDDLLPDLIFF
jgi:hypothetical protein